MKLRIMSTCVLRICIKKFINSNDVGKKSTNILHSRPYVITDYFHSRPYVVTDYFHLIKLLNFSICVDTFKLKVRPGKTYLLR